MVVSPLYILDVFAYTTFYVSIHLPKGHTHCYTIWITVENANPVSGAQILIDCAYMRCITMPNGETKAMMVTRSWEGKWDGERFYSEFMEFQSGKMESCIDMHHCIVLTNKLLFCALKKIMARINLSVFLIQQEAYIATEISCHINTLQTVPHKLWWQQTH